MAEKNKKSTLITKVGIATLLLMLVFLVVYMITVVMGSSSFFRESAEKNALLCFEEDIERAQALAGAHFDNLYEIANKVKHVPQEFINARGNNVTDECARYLLPLIAGEAGPAYKNGIPQYLIIE